MDSLNAELLSTTAPAAPFVETEADTDGAFSVHEFMARYDIGLTAFYAEVRAGRITPKKFGKRTLVPRAEARRWFNALPNKVAVAQAA